MQFYRRNDGLNYLVLHSNEWNRLKRQPIQEKTLNEQKEYVKSLNEKSRARTKTWPGHKHGVVANYEKKQQKLRETHKKLAIVNSEKQKERFQKQNSSIEAIKQARQKIFEDSCYGRRLLSAFRESKTLEERDAQVQFLKKLTEEKVIESKKLKIPGYCSFGLDKYEEVEKRCRKAKAIKMAQQNKEMYENQKVEAAKIKVAQKLNDLENINLISEMLAREHEAEENFKLMERKAKLQNMHGDKYKEDKAKSKNDYYANIMKVRKEKEELSCKINKVLREMYKSRETPESKQIYENFIQHQEQKRKSLEKIMETNDKLATNRSAKQEREERDKEIKARQKILEIAEYNKLKAICTREIECSQTNKLSSDRQSLIVRNESRLKKKERDVEEYNEKPPTHFGPCNKLMSALKKRIQQPPSWTGANTAHQEFARNADMMLRDCKYKRPARKVVDDYIKYNKLEFLDVHNYY